MGSQHIPVLLNEAIDALNIQPNTWYIDGTFGRGGHTKEILNAGGNVIAFDVDHEAITHGQEVFKNEIEAGRLILVHENFSRLKGEIEHLTSKDMIGKINGILFDFGTSVDQLKDPDRGFSFEGEAELDMRMDTRLGVKAKDLLAILPEKQLAEMLIEFGGEREARAIAKAIVKERQRQPLERVDQLRTLIEKTKREPRGHLHPATKTFQALRIAVNTELESIQEVLPQALEVLQPGGRVVCISFHEGEDRIVKHVLKKWVEKGIGQVMTKESITATDTELEQNTKARSARLRSFEKN